MKFLKYCDFFDIKFHFYIGGHPTNSSIFGGIMSIIFFILSILLMIVLSIEDLKKKNPITSVSEVPGGDIKIVNLHNSKIWVPWRMVTYEEKFIDHRGILHPIVSFIEGKWNSSFGMDLIYHTLEYKLCSETSMANKTDEYKIDIPLNECFCIDNDDIPWGGSWHGDILYYFEVNLYSCEGGIDFNSSDPRCTKMSELLKHKNTSWLFEFYYPVVQFEPTNQKNPMSVIYRSYFYRLSSHANKVERIYIRENIMDDDQSLFKSARNSTTYWGMTNIYGDSYFTPEEKDPLVKSVSSRIYSLVIYMDQGYVHYTRKYKNIFYIFSEILPLLNVVLIIFKKIARFIKKTIAKKNLTESIFENIHPNSKKVSIPNKSCRNLEIKILNEHKPKAKIKQGNSLSPRKKNIAEMNCSSILNLNVDSIKNLNLISSSNNIEIKKSEKKLKFVTNNNDNENDNNSPRVKNLNIIKYLNKNQMKRKTINDPNYNNFIISNFNKNLQTRPVEIRNYKKRPLFPTLYFYMNILFDRLIQPKSFFCFDKKYFIMYNFMVKIFDISSHIKLLKHFLIFKDFFLSLEYNSKRKHLFNFDKKININDENKMKEIESINERKGDVFEHQIF